MRDRDRGSCRASAAGEAAERAQTEPRLTVDQTNEQLRNQFQRAHGLPETGEVKGAGPIKVTNGTETQLLEVLRQLSKNVFPLSPHT